MVNIAPNGTTLFYWYVITNDPYLQLFAEGVDPRHQTFYYRYAHSPFFLAPFYFSGLRNCVPSAQGLRSVDDRRPQLRKLGMYIHILWNQGHLKMPGQDLRMTMCKGRMVQCDHMVTLIVISLYL